jgi:hypothetical protein
MDVILLLAVVGIALASLAVLFPLTVAMFVVAVYLRDEYEAADSTLRKLLLAPLYLAAGLVLLVLDVLFNAAWGSFLFREWPREWLFTSRVERHYRTCYWTGTNYLDAVPHPLTYEQRMAVDWANFLNSIDPLHVTFHKG